MNVVNFRKFKWFTLVGSLTNVALMILIIIFMNGSINAIDIYASAYDRTLPHDTYVIYYVYYYMTCVATVSLVLSLLTFSSTIRDDYTYHHFIWSYIASSLLSAAIIITIVSFQLSREYTYTYGLLSVNLPLVFSLLGVSILLPLVDIIRLKIKNSNNPFYSKKNKQNQNFYAIQDDSSLPENEEKDNEDDLANLSYYELYERRKKEIDDLNELYDSGKITLAEYNQKRKAIYKKYDKYN